MLVSVPKQASSKFTQALSKVPANHPYLLKQVNAVKSSSTHKPSSDQRFSHLLSIMPAGVLVIDKNGLVSLANQQAIILLGEPLIGEAWRDVINRVFAPKADDGHEVSMTNGKKVKIDISPLTEEKGQLIVITDLTETRELQSRVGHMQRLSSLGKMVASLAHQVRTPLSSALLYAENLKSMPLKNEMASRFSEKLTLRLKELESQVNDMLLFAKSSDKQIVSAISTTQIVEQSIAQTEAQIKQADITFVLDNSQNDTSQESTSGHQVLGNLTAITGALTNLITNAMQALLQQTKTTNLDDVKSREPRQISLSVSIEDKNKQSYCVFKVSDNGKGLEQEQIKRLFEPFYTTKSQGTGLGLAVVNTVAKSHKGFVKCGNVEPHGAFFALYLPTHIVKSDIETPQITINKQATSNNELSGVDHE